MVLECHRQVLTLCIRCMRTETNQTTLGMDGLVAIQNLKPSSSQAPVPIFCPLSRGLLVSHERAACIPHHAHMQPVATAAQGMLCAHATLCTHLCAQATQSEASSAAPLTPLVHSPWWGWWSRPGTTPPLTQAPHKVWADAQQGRPTSTTCNLLNAAELVPSSHADHNIT